MLVRNQIKQLAKQYNNTLCHNPPPHAVVSLLVVKQEIILVELAADLYCLHQQDLYKTCIAFKITSTNLYCLHHCHALVSTCTPCRGTRVHTNTRLVLPSPPALRSHHQDCPTSSSCLPIIALSSTICFCLISPPFRAR